MKKTLSLIVALFITVILIAQAPGILNYQGVARNSVGSVIVNKAVTLRLTVRDGAGAGPLVYQETRAVVTNPFGLFNIQIGSPGATAVTGSLLTVNWTNGNKFLQVEMDPAGGTSFINIGSAQLASVPYSMYTNLSGDLVLPFTKTQSDPNPLIKINNSGTGWAAQFSSSHSSPKALLTTGGLQFTGIGEGTNKLLASDANGSGTWRSASELGLLGWGLNGNAGTTPSNFIGTTDNQPVRFKVNNIAAGEIDANGNVKLGLKSGEGITTGKNNISIGREALNKNTVISEIVAIGDSALFNNGIGATSMLHGEFNTAVGSKSLMSNTYGWYNTAVGTRTLQKSVVSVGNTAIGADALYLNTTGNANTALGAETLTNNTTGALNTAVGADALFMNTTGDLNTAVGSFALIFNTTGKWNSAFGGSALNENTSGNRNIAMGAGSLYKNSTGSQNIAIGTTALFSNLSASDNIAIGDSALYSNTTGSENVAMGRNALKLNSNTDANTAIGHKALQMATSNSNTATGYLSMSSTTFGSSNAAYGFASMLYNTTGRENTAIGADAMVLNTSGSYNVGIGTNAVFNNRDGEYNVGVGFDALQLTAQGSFNTALGARSKTYIFLTPINNATAVGYDATSNASNKVVIGNTSVTVIGGYAGWSNLSDRRFKKNIHQDVAGLNFIMKLNPVTYTLDLHKLNDFFGKEYKEGKEKDFFEKSISEKEKIVYSGFEAQEVEKAAIASGYNFSGIIKPQHEKDHYSIVYSDFIPSVVKAIQEQQQMIDDLKKENAEIREQVKKLLELLSKK